MQNAVHKFELIEAKLKELSPTIVLERGFSIVRKNGKIINKIDQTTAGDMLSILMTDGVVNTEVKETAWDKQ
jgi:exonuclease VII large subunit